VRRVIHHPSATAEITEAARYYEQRVVGLGAQYLDEIDEAVKAIRALPECWPIIGRGVRRYLLQRFPFGLYYRLKADQIEILACKHHSRHPDYWRRRQE
jgi:plasmid stabilization system protein ParE